MGKIDSSFALIPNSTIFRGRVYASSKNFEDKFVDTARRIKMEREGRGGGARRWLVRDGSLRTREEEEKKKRKRKKSVRGWDGKDREEAIGEDKDRALTISIPVQGSGRVARWGHR